MKPEPFQIKKNYRRTHNRTVMPQGNSGLFVWGIEPRCWIER